MKKFLLFIIIFSALGLLVISKTTGLNNDYNHDCTYGDWEITKEASCNTNGTKVKKCTICEARMYDSIPQTEHNYEWIVHIAATKTTDGERHKVCTECENISEAITISSGSQGLEYSYVQSGEHTGIFIEGIGTCTDEEIYIPRSIDGIPVTGIHSIAGSNVKSVLIPLSVTCIGYGAFNGSPNLKAIYYNGEVGTRDENIEIKSGNSQILNPDICTWYYYSKNAPYYDNPQWHYDENGNAVIWE